MDPFLFCVFLAWALIRSTSRPIIDALGVSKGNESTGHRERMQARAQAHERRMARQALGPTVGQALGMRLADRLANPKPKAPKDRSGAKPLRGFLGQLWEDAWNEAADKLHDRKRRKDEDGDPARPERGPGGVKGDRVWTPFDPDARDPQDPAATSASARGDMPSVDPPPETLGANRGTGSSSSGGDPAEAGTGAGAGTGPGETWSAYPPPPPPPPWATGTGGHAGGDSPPAEDDEDRVIHVGPAEVVRDTPSPPEPLQLEAAKPVDDPNIVDAEVVEDPEEDSTTDHQPEHLAPVIPLSPGGNMTAATATPTETGAEIKDPKSAIAGCDWIGNTATTIANWLDKSIGDLTAQGVSGEPITLFSNILDHVQASIEAARTAREHFERHSARQDDISSDETLAGAVNGTYLDRGAS